MLKFPENVQHVSFEQGTPEWLNARAGYFTGSTINTLRTQGRGGKPSATRINFLTEKACERLTGQSCDIGFKSGAMQWGNDMEPLAREAYENFRGKLVCELGFLKDESRLFGASLDGIVDASRIIEIKCPNTVTHVGYIKDGPPSKYIDQMQWNMLLSGADTCDFISFDPRLPQELQLHVVEVARNETIIAELIALAEEASEEVQQIINDIKNIKGV